MGNRIGSSSFGSLQQQQAERWDFCFSVTACPLCNIQTRPRELEENSWIWILLSPFSKILSAPGELGIGISWENGFVGMRILIEDRESPLLLRREYPYKMLLKHHSLHSEKASICAFASSHFGCIFFPSSTWESG